jgi:hypothetical protein
MKGPSYLIKQLKILSSLLFFLTLVTSAIAQNQWAELCELNASYAEYGDNFGYSVCIDGDYAIVGAPYDYVSYTNQGSAYIFKREGENWVEKKRLTASDGASSDYFGCSVSINGDYAIVGAYYDNVSYTDQGSAYIFKREGENWVEKKRLTASDGASSDYFGCSVSINGDYAIVGAYYDNVSYTDQGSAHIFKREGENWVEKPKLIASDGASYDYFGYSVCINGDYVIVGAYGDDSSRGSAYIFKREGEVWNYAGKFYAFDGLSGDWFGYSVSISGDYAIVGAYYDDTTTTDTGSAHIFKREGDFWNQKAKLTASDRAYGDYFGCSVSINGDCAIVGAYYDDTTTTDTGSAYIFKREGEEWVEITKLTSSDKAPYDYFGRSVCISEDYAIVGANNGDGNVNDSGSAYIFGSPDCLVVNAAELPEDFICDGNEGEWPETFCQPKNYILKNACDSNEIAWRVEKNAIWLIALPEQGTLPPGEETTVTISIGPEANELEPNIYTDTIIFRNLNSGYEHTRNATLTIRKVPGEIEVKPNEVDFGDVIVGLRSETKQVTIRNLDLNPRHELIVEDISLGYLEDFNDGQAQGWQAHTNGPWEVVFQDVGHPNNGEYKPKAASSETWMPSTFMGKKWKDLDAKVKIRRNYTDYESGIFVRASEDFDYPNGTGSAYLIAENGAGNYSISKYISGAYNYLQDWTSSLYLNSGEAGNVIEVVVEGSAIEVYFNGNLEWTGTDTDIAGPGRIGLFAYQPYTDYNCYFDDVQVQQRDLTDGFKLGLPQGGPEWVLKTPYDSNEPNSIIVDVNFAPNEVGEYQSTLVIQSDDEDEPVVEVKLKGKGIRDYLVIEPNENSVYKFSGHTGGPFLPPYQTYDLTNIGPVDVNWTAEPNMTWLNVDPNGGTLKPNE